MFFFQLLLLKISHSTQHNTSPSEQKYCKSVFKGASITIRCTPKRGTSFQIPELLLIRRVFRCLAHSLSFLRIRRDDKTKLNEPERDWQWCTDICSDISKETIGLHEDEVFLRLYGEWSSRLVTTKNKSVSLPTEDLKLLKGRKDQSERQTGRQTREIKTDRLMERRWDRLA